MPEPLPPPAEIELVWEAPSQCPDDAALRARIEQMLSGPPRGEGTVRVTGTIEERAAGLSLTLTTDFRGQVERRELEAPSCDELGEATAILLAIALEPELEDTLESPMKPESESESNAVPEPEAIPDPPPSEPNAPEAPTERATTPTDASGPAPTSDAPTEPRRRLPKPSLALRIAALAELGALPGPTGGPHLALGLHWRRLRLEVHGAYLAPRLDVVAGQGALYQAGTGGVRACGRPRAGAVEFPLCGGIEGGAVRGATRGFDPPRSANAPWLGPLASVGVARRWGRVGLWAALEGAAPVLRGEFVFEGEVRFGSFPVTGRALLGLEIISNSVP